MRDATNAGKKTEAYLNKTAVFLISCPWNATTKKVDDVNIQFMNRKLDVLLYAVCNFFLSIWCKEI